MRDLLRLKIRVSKLAHPVTVRSDFFHVSWFCASNPIEIHAKRDYRIWHREWRCFILISMKDVTEILKQIDEGDPSAADHLLPLIYNELRLLAQSKLKNERSDHTLQATALVHEAYLRLVGDQPSSPGWENRGHFFASAAEAMRRILIESIRNKKTLKRGGGHVRIEFDAIPLNDQKRDEQLLSLSNALDGLDEIDPIKASLVKLRFFSGLTKHEAAEALGISPATADRYWAYARSWLQTEMQADDSHD